MADADETQSPLVDERPLMEAAHYENRTVIHVRTRAGRRDRVAWYRGSPPSAIERAIRGALGIDDVMLVSYHEQPSNALLVMNEWVPDGSDVIVDYELPEELRDEPDDAALEKGEDAPLLTGALGLSCVRRGTGRCGLRFSFS